MVSSAFSTVMVKVVKPPHKESNLGLDTTLNEAIISLRSFSYALLLFSEKNFARVKSLAHVAERTWAHSTCWNAMFLARNIKFNRTWTTKVSQKSVYGIQPLYLNVNFYATKPNISQTTTQQDPKVSPKDEDLENDYDLEGFSIFFFFLSVSYNYFNEFRYWCWIDGQNSSLSWKETSKTWYSLHSICRNFCSVISHFFVATQTMEEDMLDLLNDSDISPEEEKALREKYFSDPRKNPALGKPPLFTKRFFDSFSFLILELLSHLSFTFFFASHFVYFF